MARSVLLLLTGAIAGGVGVGLVGLVGLPESDPSAPIGGPVPNPVEPLARDVPASASSAGADSAVGARIAAFERAEGATDAIDLETMIDMAAASPRSRLRDIEISALLARLSEIDPSRAVAYARSAYLDTPFVIQAFEALIRIDREAAIAELSSVTPAARQRKVAIALLGVIGNDDAGLELIAEAFPEQARLSLELDGLIARAESDPLGALQQVMDLDRPTLQNYLLPRLAGLAVGNDAAAAFALSASIDDLVLRRMFEMSLMSAWAEQDPNAVFQWLETADPVALQASATAFQSLARNDAERLLAIVDDLPPMLRNAARSAYLQVLVERDPVAAIAELDFMAAGQEREQMMQTVAQAYAQQDPDSALAWVRTLSPPSQSAMQAVLRGIALVDVDRAIDVFVEMLDEQGSAPFSDPTSLTGSLSFSMMLSTLSSNGANVSRLTDKLLESNDPRMQSILSSTLASWSSRDMDAALSWTLANAAELDRVVFDRLGRRLAETDLDRAMTTLEQLGPTQRQAWMDGMVSQMARTDLDRAVQFVDGYRGQPGYDSAVGRLVQEMARSDPERAARKLSEVGSSADTMSAAFMIAREWSNTDPLSAARWALSEISDEQTQANALSTITSTWAQRDSAAAERWLFGLASGPERDAAANGLVQAAAQAGEFEPRYLEAYSSDEASQKGAMNAIITIGRTDPARADDLMNAHLTDPALRRQAEEAIARLSAMRSGALAAPGITIF